MTAPTLHTRRPVLAPLLVWGVPALLLLDSAYAFALGWRPHGAVETAVSALAAAWACSAVLVLHSGVRGRLAGLWRELLLLLAAVLLCWPLLEFAASRADRARRPPAPFHTRGANVHDTFEPDPAYLPGIYGPSRFSTGPDGIRAAALPAGGQIRVLCIGGSTTECVYLDDTETWPALLPAQVGGTPPIWVGNVGISGFDTEDHLRFVEESPLLDGVAALVVQPGINDLWRFLAGEVEAMDYGRFAEPVDGVDGANQVGATAARPYRPWWTRSWLIQLYHTLRQPPPRPEEREGVGGTEYQIRREKRAAAELTGDLPPLGPGLDAYRGRIEALVAACHARGVPVLFTTQAVVWRDGLPPEAAARCWFGWLPDGRYLTLGALRQAMGRYNTALAEVCAHAGAPCVDLSPLNGDPGLFYDDCHFTELGARRVAERVGPVLGSLLGR